MNRSFIAVSIVAFIGVMAVFACGEDVAPPSMGSSGTASSSGRSSSSSGSTSSSGTGSSGTASSSGGSSSGGTGDSGTDAEGGAPAADHLLISEIGVAPPGGEFIEIYNPTSQSVDLSNYYLSDNALYRGIATDAGWAPVLATANTDFLARFPSGATIAPGAVVVIATDGTFETTFGKCPNFILEANDLACANGTAKAMLAPTDGGIGTVAGLSNDREMVILFTWDGASATVKDVDYVTWGTTFDSETRVDKTGVPGYVADTDAAGQKPAVAPGSVQSIERCSKSEQGEKRTGGNGITGHDETSEPLDASFVLQLTPTPGTKNTCL
jgi:hypothetical protein